MRGELDQTLALPVTTPVPQGTGGPKSGKQKACVIYITPQE